VTVLVVGAGIAGVACARVLADAGVPVRVLERSDAVGGRMASPLLHGRPVDMGAAYFTVRDPDFAEVVGRWRTAGLARPWTEELAVLGDGRRGRAPGPMRWAAPAGLQSLVGELAGGLAVELERPVERVGPGPTVDGEQADVVVLAMPDPQAQQLVHPDSPAAAELAGRQWRAVVAVAAGWGRRTWDRLPAAFVNDHPVLTLIADDGERRGDRAPVLVAHTVSTHPAGSASSTGRHPPEAFADPDAAVGPVAAHPSSTRSHIGAATSSNAASTDSSSTAPSPPATTRPPCPTKA